MDKRIPTAKPSASIAKPNSDKRAIADREKADLFCSTFAQVARIEKNKKQDKPVRLEARHTLAQNCTCNGSRHDYCSMFTTQELNQALNDIKTGKSPGPDGVTNKLLIWLPDTTKRLVLDLINRSWRERDTPAS